MLHEGVIYRHIVLTMPAMLRKTFDQQATAVLSPFMRCGVRCVDDGWLGALEQRTGLREIIPQLVHRICRISKGSELSAHHGLRQAEGVATEQIDMAPPQRS